MARAMCSASASASTLVKTDHLRSQLDQLHFEADTTRRKANNARFRLLRLSEAVENLCRQAAVSVRNGKEDEARELLLQKKKIMLALEKSKGRVELLDELAAKLNEAISIKEAQLVKHVASDLEIDGYDDGGPVRIVSPTQDNRKTLDDDRNVTFNRQDVGEDQELVPDINSEGNTLSRKIVPDIDSEAKEAVSESVSSGNEASMISSFRGPSSYVDFMEDLDKQLDKIENDLMTILHEENPNKSRLQQLDILENIRGARMRLCNYVQEIAGTR